MRAMGSVVVVIDTDAPTAIERLRVPVRPRLSVTVTTNEAVPADVGVPEIVPVDEPIVRPAGRAPDEMVHDNGLVPPLDARVCE